MVGYPIVFDKWTEIDSWEGRFLERVLPSGPVKAMKETRQKVQYNHGMHPVVGTSGLGTPRVLKRDDFGVYCEVPLSPTSYNRDIIAPLLSDGTLDGMSFRFSVVEDKWRRPKEPSDYNPEMLPERSLIEFRWPEFGPVDWPAYQATQAGIRSQAALALWLSTPSEQRSALMSQFGIVASPERRLWVPGWEPKPPAADSVEDRKEQDPTAGVVATEGQQDPKDENGPDDQATRSEQTYQPARPTPMSPQRRESRLGQVQAWAATSARSA
jgi:HK97 family phage prohead protease